MRLTPEELAEETIEMLDASWQKIDEARKLFSIARANIVNPMLRDRYAQAANELKKASQAYMRLVAAWDMIPEAKHVRQRAKRPDRPITQGGNNATDDRRRDG